MSHASPGKHISIPDLVRRKGRSKITMVTCYDFAMARLIDQSEIDVVLVGDSLANVVLGMESTLEVDLDAMIHHARAVKRGLKRAALVVDMPFGTYQGSVDKAVENCISVFQNTGTQAVKMEGAGRVCKVIKRLVDAGMPVVGHLGLTPQSIHQLGGYKVQGKDDEAAEKLQQDALALQEAGASMLVLEMVPASLAKKLRDCLSIPIIGIGAGVDCDGQVLVLNDLLGLNEGFKPRFLKTYAHLCDDVKAALGQYVDDVQQSKFPSPEHSF